MVIVRTYYQNVLRSTGWTSKSILWEKGYYEVATDLVLRGKTSISTKSGGLIEFIDVGG